MQTGSEDPPLQGVSRGLNGALRLEETVHGRKNQEEADGENGRPGDPIPDGPINHGYRRIGGVVQDIHWNIFASCD